MRAVVLRAPGGPEQLVCEDIANPVPRPGEALVRVHAAALTRDELEWPGVKTIARDGVDLTSLVPVLAGLAVGAALLRGPLLRRAAICIAVYRRRLVMGAGRAMAIW